jgi:hypothetical protein
MYNASENTFQTKMSFKNGKNMIWSLPKRRVNLGRESMKTKTLSPVESAPVAQIFFRNFLAGKNWTNFRFPFLILSFAKIFP